MKTQRILLVLALGAIFAAPFVARATPAATDVAGVPAAAVGVHGPTSDYASGNLELVGHTDLSSAATGGIALGNNGAIALVGHCAFVGRWHDYGDPSAKVPTPQAPVQIVDVADPGHPVVVGSVSGTAINDAVAREMRSVDLPDFQLLTIQTFGKYLDENATTPGQSGLHYFAFPDGDCTKPVEVGSFSSLALRPHEFFQWLDPDVTHNVKGHPRILDFVTTPVSGGDGYVIDASDPANPSVAGAWNEGQPEASIGESTGVTSGVAAPAGPGRYTHSISLSPDGKKAYMSQWDGGFLTMDTSAFAAGLPAGTMAPLGAQSIPVLPLDMPGNAHSLVPLKGSNDLVGGDEVYVTSGGGCPFGWLRVIDQGNLTNAPSVLSQFKLKENDASNGNCVSKAGAANTLFADDRNINGDVLDGTFSMHNQTVTDRFVITSWYGGGLRVIDLADPASPAEAGFFVPAPVPAVASVPDTPAPAYGATASPDDDWWVATWSYPIVRNGLIYVSDVRNGLYILRATPGSALATNLAKFKFIEGNSNLGDILGS